VFYFRIFFLFVTCRLVCQFIAIMFTAGTRQKKKRPLPKRLLRADKFQLVSLCVRTHASTHIHVYNDTLSWDVLYEYITEIFPKMLRTSDEQCEPAPTVHIQQRHSIHYTCISHGRAQCSRRPHFVPWWGFLIPTRKDLPQSKCRCSSTAVLGSRCLAVWLFVGCSFVWLFG